MKRYFLDDRAMIVPIMLNALVLFALGFSTLPPATHGALSVVDDLFTLLFLTELLVKLRAYGWSRYIASGWNRFDFVLVMISAPSLALYFVDSASLDLDYLLVFRVARVFKFFRSLRFVPGIDHMLSGVRRALTSSVMLLFAFFIALFMVSLVSAKLFGAMAPEHFGDPIRSLYSIFKIFTVEGWFEVPDALAEQMSGPAAFFTKAYFAAMMLGAGVLGLSLVNSVFVDAMVADNNDALERKVDALHEELRAIREELVAARRKAE
jgi:voltage-gated sodium channel